MKTQASGDEGEEYKDARDGGKRELAGGAEVSTFVCQSCPSLRGVLHEPPHLRPQHLAFALPRQPSRAGADRAAHDGGGGQGRRTVSARDGLQQVARARNPRRSR
mgnify:CR=1 FL=1